MSVSLQKGANLSLSKESPNLKHILVGLGWDARATDGHPFDLDVSVFMVKQDGKVPSSAYFIFYNQLKSPEGSVEHTGDNLTGDGDGDDESVKVDLDTVPSDIDRLVFAVTIYGAQLRRQTFGLVSHAYIRIIDEETGVEITRFDLSEDAASLTAMIFGEIYRRQGEWKFRAVGQGYASGLQSLCEQYGVEVH